MGSTPNVGIITGGASGMGLAVAENLVKKGWNITIADFNEKAGSEVCQRLGTQVTFIKCDVTDYDAQVSVFAETWKRWGRLNFVFANAGIGDRINFYTPVEELENGGPPRPNLAVVDVCLYGVMYTGYLALHYFRKNANKAGTLVSTASSAGLYPCDDLPGYGAAKTGVVGFTRAMGAKLKQLNEPITVNCICPGLVPTPMVPEWWLEITPKEFYTPTSTIVKAIETFLADATITGQAAECTATEVIYRPAAAPSNDAAKFLCSGALRLPMDMWDNLKLANTTVANTN